MAKINLQFFYIGFVILLSCISCKNDIAKPIPDKHTDQSQGMYSKYLKLLKEAYESNDNFQAAVQLANLKANSSETFDLLYFAINEDDDICDKIYQWYWLYDRHNFAVNIIKLDTLKFKAAVELCDKLPNSNYYQNYAQLKDEEERLAIENKEKEDSTNFNMKLVAELRQIHFDDQEIRQRLNKKNVTPELEKELREEMRITDSMNLIKIDKILNEYGYPSRNLVGQEGNFIPALVIHHSNSLETRYKYLPLLEQAVEDGILGEGTLNMIKRRIENMELDLEKPKQPNKP